MRRYSPHMSKLVASAAVNGIEAIAESVKANERVAYDRLECLRNAKRELNEWPTDLNAAIEAEMNAEAGIPSIQGAA